MPQTLKDLQDAVLYSGPILAKPFPYTTRVIVRSIVYRWKSLTTGSDIERKWAKKMIRLEVKNRIQERGSPLTMWFISILISIILKWLMRHRPLGVDHTIAQMRK